MSSSRPMVHSPPHLPYYHPLPTFLSSTDPQPYLITLLLVLSVALLFLDLAARVLYFASRRGDSASCKVQPSKGLLGIAQQLLIDFRALETQLMTNDTERQDLRLLVAAKHTKHVELQRHLNANHTLHKGKFAELQESHARLTSTLQSKRQALNNNAFAAFCEQLLLANKVWKREKELKALRATLESETKALSDNAFSAFVDRLLLWNRVWKQEKEINMLRAGCERMKRSRVAVITGMAKRMVVDVRKEHLVEDFVKDIIEELEDSKKQIATLRSDHEREIEEINNEWIKDYRKLVRETKKLKLSQQARLVEQQVANEMEDSLLDSLQSSKRKAEVLEEKVSEYEKLIYGSCESSSNMSLASLCGHYASKDNSDVGDDNSSTDVSESSTCVSAKGSFSAKRVAGSVVRPLPMQRCCSKDHGARSPTAHLPNRNSIEGSLLLEGTSYAIPRNISDDNRSVVFRFDPFRFIRPGPSPAHLACTSSKSRRVPAGSRRAALSPLKIPKQPTHARGYRSPVTATRSSSVVRSAKRFKIEPWRL